jgi:hypothetical protein
MPEIQIRLAALWIAVMLTYLLGDVLRIFAGDFQTGELGGIKATQGLWLVAAAVLLIPIVMLLVSVMFDGQVTRWLHIVAAIGLFVFNVVGLPTYPGLYDKFLIVVGLGLNALTVWTAWGWKTG